MGRPTVIVEREGAMGTFLVLCDHATNHIQDRYAGLGLDRRTRHSHAAWDPGALPLARALAERLDAPLVYPTVSRLVVDCNRVEDAPDLFPERTEAHDIPGNRNLGAADRAERIETVHTPYHAEIERLVRNAPSDMALVGVHSFTPRWHGQRRPWQVGVLHDHEAALADRAIARLEARGDLTVGRNQPYSPADGVYYTLARHGTGKGRRAVMLEVRNDQIETPEAQRRWAEILADALTRENA